MDIAGFWDWVRCTFRGPPKPKRLELRFVTYAEGDRLIREEGWQLGLPEEDTNRVLGMVYVERVGETGTTSEMTRLKLWDFFVDEHNLYLLDSQLNDIIRAVEAYQSSEPTIVTFHAVKEDDGHINHTTIMLKPEEAIEEFLRVEQAMNLIGNAGRINRGETPHCAKSWEHLEAEGFSVVPVRILEVKP